MHLTTRRDPLSILHIIYKQAFQITIRIRPHSKFNYYLLPPIQMTYQNFYLDQIQSSALTKIFTCFISRSLSALDIPVILFSHPLTSLRGGPLLVLQVCGQRIHWVSFQLHVGLCDRRWYNYNIRCTHIHWHSPIYVLLRGNLTICPRTHWLGVPIQKLKLILIIVLRSFLTNFRCKEMFIWCKTLIQIRIR